jgi:hypothetical protein
MDRKKYAPPFLFFFSSPDPLGQVSLCHHFASVVRPYTITKNILLWNRWRFFKFHSPFLFLVTPTMLVGGQDCRTQFWKGITNGPFHQSLVLSGQVVSEENIFSNCVRTDDRRKVMTKAHMTLWVTWAKKKRKGGAYFFLWSPSKIVSDSPDLQPTWSLLLKIKKGNEI